MKTLTFNEIELVLGGNGGGTSPSCTPVTTTDSSGNSVTVQVCECPTGTKLEVSTRGGKAQLVCVPA